MERLEGKVAIITGTAIGIGEADARLFAKEGAKVVVTDIKEVEGRMLAENIKKEGGEAIFLKLDVAKESDWERVISEVIRKYGKLNILLNNAGVIFCKALEETSLDEWNWIMNINSTGVFLGTKYAIEAMKDNGEPCSIINRSSVDAMVGESTAAALACAEAGYTIRVNSVHPGEVHTAMLEKEAKDYELPVQQYMEQMEAMHPIGFIGEPIDIAYMDLYLASDESRWVTGSELVIGGGFLVK